MGPSPLGLGWDIGLIEQFLAGPPKFRPGLDNPSPGPARPVPLTALDGCEGVNEEEAKIQDDESEVEVSVAT